MKKIYRIYSLTNITENKKYIGLTSNKYLSERISRGYKKNTKINKAIEKYGKKDFNVEILFETDDKNIAEEKEKYYIKLFNTQENGYNICEGGYINKENLDRSKKVRCIELNKVFNSCKEAQKIMNIKSSHICDVCNGRRNKCNGFHWEYV